MSASSNSKDLAQRSTHRVTITVPDAVFQALNHHSFRQGRSLSNFAAFLLEHHLISITS